ncbi:MAG: hypothetical protein OXQ32_12760 [bacterium]|nr:hypothetical protein [bacterium]
MLNIAFIEDDEASVKPVLNMILREEPDVNIQTFDFDAAAQGIRSFRPDIVILDLWEGEIAESSNRGSEHLDFIWNQQFCPVIIHSANPDIPPEQTNAFVIEVTKGQNSPLHVLTAIREFKPHVQALKDAEDDIRDSYSIAMRDVAPSTFDVITDVDQRNEALRRAGRRRLAALMDESSISGQLLASWEQYLYPPVSNHLLLGDVLRQAGSNWRDPESFRIVLTPSCDLVSTGERGAKVSNVLVAKCFGIRAGISLTSWKDMSPAKLKDRLIRTVLSRGYFESIVPFPALQGRIPTMVAHLRDLDTIPLDDIGQREEPFLRVASLDSPFRELVSWAHVIVSGRPGIPERDLQSWRDQIVVAYEEAESK